MRTLQRFTIKGWKSIREQTLELGRLNVFIGGNGAGKSNLIGVFRLLRELVNKNLASYTLTKGGADTLLHFGRKRTKEMLFDLEFAENEGTSNGYEVRLSPSQEDTLLVARENSKYHEKPKYKTPYVHPVENSGREAGISEDTHRTSSEVAKDLQSYRVYHFHDTSESAEVKGLCDVDDNRALRPQAENLAAFLYWMMAKEQVHFANIEATIQQIAPFFERFRLEPSRLNESKIRLTWREKGTDPDALFNAHALSDGTLRFICLATLLLQPELPPLILLDEPELGLHPAAITLLGDLLQSAATRTQVIVATQSVTLVDQFLPEHIWTVEHQGGQSVFSRLDAAALEAWFEKYSLGELWLKNVLGARP